MRPYALLLFFVLLFLYAPALGGVWTAWAEVEQPELFILCSSCGTVLEVVPPAPDVVVAPVLTPLACPVCGAIAGEAGSTGFNLRVVKPLVPAGCYSPEPPYGCHGGSFLALWRQHTWDMRAIQKLGIAEGDCLRCHVTQEELDQLCEQHPFGSWRWYEKAKQLEKQAEQPWVRIPSLSPWVALTVAGWILVAGVAALAKKRWA